MSTQHPIHLDDSQAGARLDVWLRNRLNTSRAGVGRVLDQGWVTLNGRVTDRRDKGFTLRAGDRITLDPRATSGEQPAADDALVLSILAEQDGWLVVDKPAGIAVRPRSIDEVGTVLNAVVAKHPGVIGVGEAGLRSGIVHRLDTDTSGVLVVATRQEAWEMWREAFAEHRTAKRYLAVIAGVIDTDVPQRIERDLTVANHRPSQVRVDPLGAGSDAARACVMQFEVVEKLLGATLVSIDLETGFLHQIRAMMADLGHPVIGDALYGQTHTAEAAPRQMLHAQSLSLDDYLYESPIPADMNKVVDRLRG